MTNNLIPRRRVLAGAGALAANGSAASHLANAQGRVRSPAAPLVRPADFILKNGNVITIDPASTIVQAVATAADRIIAVGPNDAMIPHTGPETRVIDLKGKTVVPGLTDGHAHIPGSAPQRLPFPWFCALDP